MRRDIGRNRGSLSVRRKGPSFRLYLDWLSKPWKSSGKRHGIRVERIFQEGAGMACFAHVTTIKDNPPFGDDLGQ